MIASIRGEVLAEGAGWIVVAVGGLGYRVEVSSARVAAHPGDEVFLHTSLIVREDSMTLFGFSTRDELEVFTLLLGVSGVGPRSALGVLTELTPAQIAQAVIADDDKPFRRVSGVGPKTAKLISVSLSGKINSQTLSGVEEVLAAPPVAPSAATSVQAALVGLGYAEAQAELAVSEAVAAGAPEDEAGLLRATLALLQAPRLGARGGAQS